MSEPEAAPPTTTPVAPSETPAQIPVVTQTHATQISPATPAQEKMSETRQVETERITQGQRKINLIWELTQALIAVAIVVATITTAVSMALSDDPATQAQGLTLMAAAFFLVVGTYFQRTNHIKTGGPGGGDVARDR